MILVLYINKDNIIHDSLANIKPVNDIFKLYRYGFNKLSKPNTTENPTLSVSLFIKDLPEKKANPMLFHEWFNRYFYNNLELLIAFNYYFPNGSIRLYLDWYSLDLLKTLKSDIIQFQNPIIREYSFDFETLVNGKFNVSECFKRYIKYINENLPVFNNFAEKFLYYLVIASKIYNNTDSNEDINMNKEADFFVYKFDEKSDFTEIKNGVTSHITNGFIGQGMRYICLRQIPYMYNDIQIQRNKHFIWRDGHSNQTGFNDAEIIKIFNSVVKKSNKKIYNLMPSNNYYVRGWHEGAVCPSEKSIWERRSAIAGVVQMVNFTDSQKWFSDEIYYSTIGMLFLLDNNNKVTLKYHRKEGYSYGIEEYIFNNFFKLEYFRKINVYFNDYFLYHTWFLDCNFDVIMNIDSLDNIEKSPHIVKTTILLLLYLIKKQRIPLQFTFVDFINQIEILRNNPPIDINERKWLGFLLSIYPTKYFIQPTIFNQSSNHGCISYSNQWSSITSRIDKKYPIFDKEIKDLTWQDLNSININCNTPIVNSNVEWCRNEYLNDTKHCPPDVFFSGFYTDKPTGLEYGIFRNPAELEQLVELIDNRSHNIV
jgi:hypothetical protein